MSEDHVDVDALEELKEVMEDEFPNLIHTYLEDSVVRLDSLKDAVGKLDTEMVRKEAHSFKGSSGNIGAPLLADLCRRLEDMGKGGDVNDAKPLLDEIVVEYQEVKTIMETMLS